MAKKQIIALNRMFAGAYLEDERNIGHETINLFKTDNGDNFIYLQPYGHYSHDKDGRFESILLVRGVGKGIFEIMGKAEQLEPLPVLSEKCGGKRKDDKLTAITLVHEKQLEVVKELEMNYGGVSIDKLYVHNKYDDVCIYATFKANKVRLPKRALYITEEKDNEDKEKNVYYVATKNQKFARQNLKMYFEEGSDGYDTLKKIIGDDSLWQTENNTEKLSDQLYLGDKEITFLDIIKKNNDEVVFSNLIAYYLSKYKPLLNRFVERFIGSKLRGDIQVFREKYHIDILLQDGDGNSVIIENKIKSGINGKLYNEDGAEESNQLKEYIKELNKKDGVKKEQISCLLFVPNYHNINLDDEDKNNYQIVKYSDVYNFFKSYVLGVEDFAISDKYYVDFVRALKTHTKEVDNSFQEEMKRRFVASILENKK